MKGIKNDTGKNRVDLIPVDYIEKLGLCLTYGASKYGANNWQGLDKGKDRYYGALLRHAISYRKGKIIDEESGLHPLHQMAINCMFLFHFEDDEKYKEELNKWIKNNPKKSEWIKKLQS